MADMTTRDELMALADELDGWHDCADGDVSAGNGHFRLQCVSDSDQQRLNLRATLREAASALRRLASRQEVSVEELARSICRTDHINGAPSCVMDDHPERDPCDDENCRRFEQARALLAKYSITNRTE